MTEKEPFRPMLVALLLLLAAVAGLVVARLVFYAYRYSYSRLNHSLVITLAQAIDVGLRNGELALTVPLEIGPGFELTQRHPPRPFLLPAPHIGALQIGLYLRCAHSPRVLNSPCEDNRQVVSVRFFLLPDAAHGAVAILASPRRGFFISASEERDQRPPLEGTSTSSLLP